MVEKSGATGNFVQYPTLCDPMDCSKPGSLSFTISRSLLKLMSTESVMPSNLSFGFRKNRVLVLVYNMPQIYKTVHPALGNYLLVQETTGTTLVHCHF